MEDSGNVDPVGSPGEAVGRTTVDDDRSLPDSWEWRLAAAIALGIAFVLLPWWDASERAQLEGAVSGVFGGGSRNTTGMPLEHLAAAALAAIAVYRGSRDRYAVAVVALVLAGGWTTCSTLRTGAEIAKRRSHAVDSWPVCHGEVTTLGGGHPIEGPALADGTPCTLPEERRDDHRASHPDGDVVDGLAQIRRRFPEDRDRVFRGSAWTFGLLIAAATCLAVAYRRRRRALRLAGPAGDEPAWVDPDDRPRLR